MAAALLEGKDADFPVLPPREKCLLRPDMYIGTTVPEVISYLCFEPHQDEAGKITSVTTSKKTVKVCPALLQMVYEIVGNAADQIKVTDVRHIKVDIDTETGSITVFNDGSGIPIRPHTQFPDRMVPDVIFSEPNSSSNYDDDKERTGIGRNGEGAKVTNWWSVLFIVETCDSEHIFKMKWSGNGSMAHKPSIKTTSRKTGYTKVTFIPDYKRLNLMDNETSIEALGPVLDYLKSSIWSLCAVTDKNVSIHLNGTKLPVRSAIEYAKVLAGDEPVAFDENDDGTFQVCVWSAVGAQATQMGFVNSIPCNEGTHMAHAVSRLAEAMDVSEVAVRHNCCLLVNTTVRNPSFESQCKTRLRTSWRTTSSPKYIVSEAMKRALKRTKVAAEILNAQKFDDDRKASKQATKDNGSRQGPINVVNYAGARRAGKSLFRRKGGKCWLILTEGLSALNFALAGLLRNFMGAYPLRGKPINPRDKTMKKILENEEIKGILTILGVRSVLKDLRPTRPSELRYDGVWVLADQDTDGAHIVALVSNIFAFLLPELMASTPGFVSRFATPLIRAIPKKPNSNDQVMEFMTKRAFDLWFEQLSNSKKRNYETKYFKGLGTSTARDAKRCFNRTDKLVVGLTFNDEQDWVILDEFFGKKTARRKDIVGQVVGYSIIKPGDNSVDNFTKKSVADEALDVDYTRRFISMYEYMIQEYMAFPIDDCKRSLPDAVDGLSVVMRKILWTLFIKYKAMVRPKVRVSQVGSASAEFTGYHHGEASICGSVTNMGRDYHLSCNINLLVPSGQFGTRHVRKAAQPRYLFTCLEPIARALFPPEDIPVLKLTEEEGQQCEPYRFVPVIPYILCNGKTGAIATGFSCELPPHNVKDIITWCRAYIQQGFELPANTSDRIDIRPWIEGYGGDISISDDGGSVTFSGRVCLDPSDPCQVHVTELAVTTDVFWNVDSKEKSGLAHIKWIQENEATMVVNGDVNEVDMTIQFAKPVTDEQMSHLRRRAETTMSYSNMNLWTEDGRLRGFSSVQDIARYHAEIRLNMNARRKAYQLREIQERLDRSTDAYEFVKMCIESQGALVFRRPRADIDHDLAAAGLKKRKSIQARKASRADNDDQDNNDDNDDGNDDDNDNDLKSSYDYLLSMKIASFTAETLLKLKQCAKDAQRDYNILEAKSTRQMWLEDLDRFEQAYRLFTETRNHRRENPEPDDDLASYTNINQPTKARKRKHDGPVGPQKRIKK